MIKLQEQINISGIPLKLLLQVHDELVLEVPKDIVDTSAELVKSTMEECVKLKVPLLVDVGIGDNWMNTK